MTGDRTSLVAFAIGGVAVLGFGAVSFGTKGHRFARYEHPYPLFRETSTDHGMEQAKRELSHLYQGLMKFAERTHRLPAGDPFDQSSEFRKELHLSDDDVRVPIEWSRNMIYLPRFLESRCDGVRKPAFPERGVRDVWMSCETGGDKPSVVLLWSDGKIEVRSGGERMLVRLRTNPNTPDMISSTLAYADEPGVPLVFRTLDQRDQMRASLPPPQFRMPLFGRPFGPGGRFPEFRSFSGERFGPGSMQMALGSSTEVTPMRRM